MMKNAAYEKHTSGLYSLGGEIPADERVFVSDELAQVLLKSHFLEERHFFELERLIEKLQQHHRDERSELAPPLSQVILGLDNLPQCARISSKLPVLIPVVHLACNTGKCVLIEHLKKGRPWFDDAAFEVFRLQDADIVCYVEKPLSSYVRYSEHRDLKVFRGNLEVFTLTIWISVFGQARSLAGILEQAVLFAQPELYLKFRIFGQRHSKQQRASNCPQELKLLEAFAGG